MTVGWTRTKFFEMTVGGKAGEAVQPFGSGIEGTTYGADPSPDGSHLAVVLRGMPENKLVLVSKNGGHNSSTRVVPVGGQFHSVKWSSDSQMLLLWQGGNSIRDGRIVIVDRQTLARKAFPGTGWRPRLHSVQWLPGSRLVAVGSGASLWIVDLDANSQRKVWSVPEALCRATDAETPGR